PSCPFQNARTAGTKPSRAPRPGTGASTTRVQSAPGTHIRASAGRIIAKATIPVVMKRSTPVTIMNPSRSFGFIAHPLELASAIARRKHFAHPKRGFRSAPWLPRARAQAKLGQRTSALEVGERYALLGAPREQQPGNFRHLRLDGCARYRSDPGVCARI